MHANGPPALGQADGRNQAAEPGADDLRMPRLHHDRSARRFRRDGFYQIDHTAISRRSKPVDRGLARRESARAIC